MHLFGTHDVIIVFYGDRSLESHLDVSIVVGLSDVLHVDVDSLVSAASATNILVVVTASLAWVVQFFQRWLLVIMCTQYWMAFGSFLISFANLIFDGHHACSGST